MPPAPRRPSRRYRPWRPDRALGPGSLTASGIASSLSRGVRAFAPLGVASLLVLAASAARAHAQEPGPTQEPAPTTVAPTQAELDQLFTDASHAYAEERWAEAAVLLERAWQRDPQPAFQHNLGRCYERLGRWGEAARAYRAYLGVVPDAENAAELRTRIIALEARAAPIAAVRDDISPSVTSEVMRDDSREPWSILVAGVGLGGLVSAVALGVAAQTTRDGAPSASSAIEALARVEQAQDLATATNVAWIAGGVLASVGVIWLVVEVASGGAASRAGIEASADGVHGRF